MLFEKVKMSVEMEMFTLIIFHKIKENIRSDNKEWIQAHTKGASQSLCKPPN